MYSSDAIAMLKLCEQAVLDLSVFRNLSLISKYNYGKSKVNVCKKKSIYSIKVENSVSPPSGSPFIIIKQVS